jgi:hypothetical protein
MTKFNNHLGAGGILGPSDWMDREGTIHRGEEKHSPVDPSQQIISKHQRLERIVLIIPWSEYGLENLSLSNQYKVAELFMDLGDVANSGTS